tara:strand:- start:815 stop:1021 length:207 start_codon:yes stop_codon:yes gene_type:complete
MLSEKSLIEPKFASALLERALEDVRWLLECQKNIPEDLQYSDYTSMKEVEEQAILVINSLNLLISNLI